MTQVRLDALLGAWALSAAVCDPVYTDRPFRFASEKLHKAIMVKMGGMGGARSMFRRSSSRDGFRRPAGIPSAPDGNG